MVVVLAPGAGGATSMIFGPGLTTARRLWGSSGEAGGAASGVGRAGTATTGTGTANGTGTTTAPGSANTSGAGTKVSRLGGLTRNPGRCGACGPITTGPPAVADPGSQITTASAITRRVPRRRRLPSKALLDVLNAGLERGDLFLEGGEVAREDFAPAALVAEMCFDPAQRLGDCVVLLFESFAGLVNLVEVQFAVRWASPVS